MERIYSYLGPEHSVNLLARHFESALESQGYSCRVDAGSAVGPHVMEFAKGGAEEGRIISMSLDHTRGEPGDLEVVLETEEYDQDVATVVAEGLFGLLAETSREAVRIRR